jgi:hypothetical protein
MPLSEIAVRPTPGSNANDLPFIPFNFIPEKKLFKCSLLAQLLSLVFLFTSSAVSTRSSFLAMIRIEPNVRRTSGSLLVQLKDSLPELTHCISG